MLHAVIMAGGSGTRFWPVSRRDRPKQFLSLVDGRSLLRITFERIQPLVPPDRIWVVTTGATAELTRRDLAELPADHVLSEPVGRDTAACAGLAAVAVRHHDPDAVCVVLPADHVIRDASRFRRAMAAGSAHVEREGGLLTFGVRPTRPETGFGYLRIGAEHGTAGEWSVHSLAEFVEKPDLDTARRYLAEGGYLWNSGMFVWPAAELLDEIRRQLPRLAEGLERIAGEWATPRAASIIAEVYPTLPRISIDYGVMEGARRRWTIPVAFPWSDVGAWPALGELLDADADGNATRGRVVALDCRDTVIVGDGTLVAASGVRDLVVVATADAVLVVPAAEAQRVKDLVAAIEDRGWDDAL
ncbi:MAG TPA: mannose-1-phosphate guanylyltransferase [Thermoanaerobaculales bacterium]|nr:mannose-1-phosphate guanylyltransferase [Thermoanaerobaculales bacterium]HPA79256.1 mannose-1-phosphate guanylyltransferase [Thermoanaerobaculales bacterium]HQL29096.1 mannose-1-phosphate guanylyltransferase [Thermoanaerobaculales bacterium]HQN97206.1 mannose-1-phosphate guanylyltransferase [Thermoanaerobaculales bacterium]HQP42600.1 mannose-1-phosphate guanylyltransferase [Thermoanaerobaculales bacterium]